MQHIKDKPLNFPHYRARLRELMPDIHGTAPDFELGLGLKALTWALNTNKSRGIPKGELFSDPLVLVKALVDIVGADTATLYAAILYPSMRPNVGQRFDTTYFDAISDLFRGDDAIVKKEYTKVQELAVNALQIRAIDLIALPHPLTTIESAFDKPSAKEAENLAAYFILSRNIAKDQNAFAIRATQWHLRLVDMRENPDRYMKQDRLHAYYYTDKFYAPFLEYLALQKLKDDPAYSPQAEVKGLYRLKMAMEEELMLQIAPDEHRALQTELREMLHGFDLQKGNRPERANKKLFDRVRMDIEDELAGLIAKAGIPKEFVRIEARLKSPRSIYQKVRAGRTDIHDRFGIRIIVDIEALLRHDSTEEAAKQYTGKLHALIAAKFEAVPKRFRNFYVKPYEPDNGYRAVQDTFKIFGRDIEIQIVDKNSHLNNLIGNASHFFFKLFGAEKGTNKSNPLATDIMKAFSAAASYVVVRTRTRDSRAPGRFFVLKNGATISDLAKRIHSELDPAGAVVTNGDPMNPIKNMRVDLNFPLLNGAEVYIEKRPGNCGPVLKDNVVRLG